MPATRGRVRLRAIGHALVLCCVLSAGGAANAPAAAPPADFYGVNAGGTLANDPAARPAAFAAMRAGGLSYVRTDASWGGVEPKAPVGGAHAYAWAKVDGLVADLARNDLRWYPTVGYSAEWAASVAGDPFSPPAGNAGFASFAGALAARYGANGSFWAEHPELPKLPTTVYGIWNEPSNARFWRGPDATPARYMSLYLAARAAIKAVDPAARVATAGLLDSGVVDASAFLRAMLASASAGGDRIDAVGWHPYVGEVELVLSSIRRARSALDDYGLSGVPIEVSEVGWHAGVPDGMRTTWMRGLAARLPSANMNVTRLMPYVWSGDPVWQITRPDGALAPLGDAYLAGIHDARSAQAASPARSTLTGRQALSACRVRSRSAPRRSSRIRNCLPPLAKRRRSLARHARRAS